MLTDASKRRLDGVHPDLRAAMLRAVDLTDLPVQISEGLRSQERQDELYAQGRTRPGKIVTWTRNSRHITGHAVDVVMIKSGKADWSEALYDRFAETVKQAAAELDVLVVWGGDWKSTKDRPHFELDRTVYPKGSTVSRLRPTKPFDAQRFERVMELVLATEGGWNPADPSMRGITLDAYRRWLGRPVSVDELKALSVADAKKIYRADYWNAVRADELPAGLDYAVVDFAIHSGPAVAVMKLQQVVGTEQDGVIGPITLAAVRLGDMADTVERLMDLRLARMRTLDNWEPNQAGWTERVRSVRAAALAMLEQDPGSEPSPTPDPNSQPLSTEDLRDQLKARGWAVSLSQP